MSKIKNLSSTSEKLFSNEANYISSNLTYSDAILNSNPRTQDHATIDITQPSPPSRTGYQIPKKQPSAYSTYASTKTITTCDGGNTETFNLKPKYKVDDQAQTF